MMSVFESFTLREDLGIHIVEWEIIDNTGHSNIGLIMGHWVSWCK